MAWARGAPAPADGRQAVDDSGRRVHQQRRLRLQGGFRNVQLFAPARCFAQPASRSRHMKTFIVWAVATFVIFDVAMDARSSCKRSYLVRKLRL
jgi:hypothetical protein